MIGRRKIGTSAFLSNVQLRETKRSICNLVITNRFSSLSTFLKINKVVLGRRLSNQALRSVKWGHLIIVSYQLFSTISSLLKVDKNTRRIMSRTGEPEIVEALKNTRKRDGIVSGLST